MNRSALGAVFRKVSTWVEATGTVTGSEAGVRTRLIGALAALVSAAVHLYLWFDGVKDQGTVGALFVVNVLAGAVIAVLLLRWRHWIPLFLLAGFGASTLGAFLIATTGGLFGIHTGWKLVCLAGGGLGGRSHHLWCVRRSSGRLA